MNQRGFPSVLRGRFNSSFRGWLEFALLVIMIGVLIAIEPINKSMVRKVIDQNTVDQQLSDFADEVVVHALLSRRFEKDMLLNLNNDSIRSEYQAQWTQANVDLERAIQGFHAAAVTDVDRNQANRWLAASKEYRTAVLDTLQAIDDGRLTRPTEANQALEAAKVPIRTLTDTATNVARAKDTAADTSSSAIRNTLETSARLLTLLILVGCLLWIAVGRRA